MLLLYSNHFHNTFSELTPSPATWLEIVCHTSWMLLRDKVKSCAIPDGAGGTSGANRLGQEAVLCDEEGCRDRK